MTTIVVVRRQRVKNVLQGENLNAVLIMDAASAFCAVSSLVLVSVLYHSLCLIDRKVFRHKTILQSLLYVSLCCRGTHKSAT